MIRLARATSMFVLAILPFAACDTGGDLVIVPEVEQTFGFEGTLEGWALGVSGLDAGQGDLEATQDEAAEGSGSAALRLESTDGNGKVWMERVFELTAGKTYEVTLAFDFATSDGGAVTPWQIVAGGGVATDLGPVLGVRDDTGNGGGTGLVWARRTVTFEARAGSQDGMLRLGLGVEAATADERRYFVDELEVRLVRVD